MTDIVERLRQLALDRNGGNPKGVELRSEWKAAAEIERLREALEGIEKRTADCIRVNKLGRLRSQLGGGKAVQRTVLNCHDNAHAALKETSND